MATRHHAVMEAGGWVLLVAVIAALIYLLFSSKSYATSVSSTVDPTAGVPKITVDIADQIAAGIRTARVYSPGAGAGCGSDETVMDAGSGNLWCVGNPQSLPTKGYVQ